MDAIDILKTVLVLFGVVAFIAITYHFFVEDVKKEKAARNFFAKIKGHFCEHKLTKERFIVIDMNVRYKITVRCKDGKIRTFSFSELNIFEDDGGKTERDNSDQNEYVPPIGADLSTRMN